MPIFTIGVTFCHFSGINKVRSRFTIFLIYILCNSSFNMEEIKLSDDVFEQIKDFDVHDLTKEQELLIDKLILNEELKNRCKEYGLCKDCKKPNTGYFWCQRHLQQIGPVEIMKL